MLLRWLLARALAAMIAPRRLLVLVLSRLSVTTETLPSAEETAISRLSSISLAGESLDKSMRAL